MGRLVRGWYRPLVGVMSLGLALAACTGASVSATAGAGRSDPPASDDGRPAVATYSLAGRGSRLALVLGNDWVFMKNRGTVDLANGLSVELSMDPYPPTRLRLSLDLYLTHQGDPASDASLDVKYDMVGMPHGPFTAPADNLGDGHYRAVLDYAMFAAWEHMVTVSLPEGPCEFVIGILLFPAVL
ncbi:MAG: hypothetical protein HYY01_01515 [Chloroflexi bacterium]|nr:hypothetical protein [Chloroflexota bacterium]